MVLMGAVLTWQVRLPPILAEVMRSRSVPGFVIARVRDGAAVEYLVTGTDAAGTPLAADTLIPVASITKLATALAVLRLVASGAVALDDPLARHLPNARAAVAGVTLRALLCHTSGLPCDLAPGVAPYQLGLDWPALAHGCLATPIVREPWARVYYSNVGIGLLAIVVERHTAQRFADALAELVLEPLGIEGTLGQEPPRPPARIAEEIGEHAGTALEPYNSVFWRSLALPWGGLVTTAAGALRLVAAFGNQPPAFLPASLRAEATRNQAEELEGGFFPPLLWPHCAWGLGVELRGDKAPHWTPKGVSAGSYGHVGASGCLVWSDPATGVSWFISGLRTFDIWWMRWPVIGAAILADVGDPPADT
jgi:CubicO group peptidase (beta-lactamase class C family)